MQLVTGRIVKTHGVRGEVVLEVRTDSPEDRFRAGQPLPLTHPRTGAAKSLTISALRWHQGRLLLQLEGIDSRDAAEELRGYLSVVQADELDLPEDPDEFYPHQLIGLAVVHADAPETVIGEIRDVLHLPGGDTLVFTQAEAERMLPFTRQFVPEVQLAQRRVLIAPPAGLFDD